MEYININEYATVGKQVEKGEKKKKRRKMEGRERKGTGALELFNSFGWSYSYVYGSLLLF